MKTNILAVFGIYILCNVALTRTMDIVSWSGQADNCPASNDIVISMDPIEIEPKTGRSNPSTGSRPESVVCMPISDDGEPNFAGGESISPHPVTISARDIMNYANISDVLTPGCVDLVQEKFDALKLSNPNRHISLIRAILGTRGSVDKATQDEVTSFLLEVFSRGIESYKSDLAQATVRNTERDRTIKRQTAVTTGSMATAVISGATTLASVGIAAYFTGCKK